MKFQIATVVFRKRTEIKVLIPGDMPRSEVEKIAKIEAADGLRDFDTDDWYAEVGAVNGVEIPPETLHLSLPHGYARIQRPVADVFKNGDLLVIDTENEKFACPEDCHWWIVDEEQLDELRAKERRLQDINHPDQIQLFGEK